MKTQPVFYSMFMLIIIAGPVLSQTQKIDSLRDQLKTDSANLTVLTRLAALLADKNDVEAMMHARKAKLIASVIDDTAFIVRSSRLIGQLYNRQSNVRMAIEELAPL